jgi:hypothetical protein
MGLSGINYLTDLTHISPDNMMYKFLLPPQHVNQNNLIG